MSDDDNDDLGELAPDSFSPSAWRGQTMAQLLKQPRGMPVPETAEVMEEIDRILALPWREPVVEGSATAQAMVELGMRRHAREVSPGDCPCGCGLACNCRNIDRRIAEINPRTGRTKRRCVHRLKWEQAWTLFEMSVVGGVAASAPVGLGKCLDPFTEVFDYKRGRRRFLAECGDLSVASFDGTLCVKNAAAFPSGEKQCLQLKLADGTTIVASVDHPIKTARGWVRADELTTSDMVAVAVEMPEPQTHTLANDNEVKFVAYMLSDGACSQNQLTFTNADRPVIDDWMKAARALRYRITEAAPKSRARNFRALKGRERAATGPGHYISVEDKVRLRWGLYGLAKNKRVHPDVWGLPRRQIALFLNRFWACDGHVSKSTVEITLASEKLVDDLRFLLLRLGVRSRKSYKVSSYVKNGERHKFDSWRLALCGESALRFLEEVGDVLGKERACRRLRNALTGTRRNTNRDVVPIGPAELHEICDELGLHPQRSGPGNKLKDGRTKVHRQLGATRGQHISRAKFLKFCRERNYQGKYAHLATSDVAWERVVEAIDVGVRRVYDLTVPGTHNFVANGVVVHNSLLDIIGAMAFRNVEIGLLLIPPNLRRQILLEHALVAEHFHVPNFRVHMPGKLTLKSALQHAKDGRVSPTVHVVPYNFISGEKNSVWIENLRPDAILLDEFDSLADLESSRTMRFMRFLEEHYLTTRVAAWTGSATDSSISEMAHILLAALRKRSPMPTSMEVIDQFSRHLDAVKNPCPPGALERFLQPGDESVRLAFARRVAGTAGCIMIGGERIIRTDAGELVECDVREKVVDEIPQRVLDALHKARNSLRPDSMVSDDPDEIIVDELEQARVVRQIALGVFYRWDWKGVSRPLALEWLAKRRAWNAELREKMLQGEPLLDSEKLCTDAAKRAWGDLPRSPDLPEWRARNWPAWRDIQDRCKPETVAEWIDKWLVHDVADWACSNKGIVWYCMREFAMELGKLTGLKVYGEGSGAELAEGLETGKITGEETIIASLKSHGRGTNGLQFIFDTNGIINAIASARMTQQVLGRTCRDGQQSSVVTTDVWLHTREIRSSFDDALRRAVYVQDMTSEEQMLLRGWRGYQADLRDR